MTIIGALLRCRSPYHPWYQLFSRQCSEPSELTRHMAESAVLETDGEHPHAFLSREATILLRSLSILVWFPSLFPQTLRRVYESPYSIIASLSNINASQGRQYRVGKHHPFSRMKEPFPHWWIGSVVFPTVRRLSYRHYTYNVTGECGRIDYLQGGSSFHRAI